MHEILLDVGILSAVRLWMEPLPNQSLPAAHLRRTLLELVKMLPVETDHLRESQIGRIVMYFSRRPRESPDVQRLAKELLSRWSRPIIGDRFAEPSKPLDSFTHENAKGPVVLQSTAYKQMAGRAPETSGGGTTMSAQQRKLVMHLQKKTKSSRKIL